MSRTPGRFRVRPEVAEAVAAGQPVVALESTLLVHGLPYPRSLEVAREVEAVVRTEGGVPATIGVLRGEVVIGMDGADLASLVGEPGVPKLATRDVAVAVAHGGSGATTVASTARLAVLAGIQVFATGGLGGVHREARETWDESADLAALARVPVVVVCSGVKSILDVPATLERLETVGVAVVGFRTRRFPGFYLSDSGCSLDWSVGSAEEVAGIVVAQEALGLGEFGLVVANPLPEEEQLDPTLHDKVLAEALDEVRRRGIRGKAVTPALLDYFHRGTGGESLEVNVRIIRQNARLAARIAGALAGMRREGRRGTDGEGPRRVDTRDRGGGVERRSVLNRSGDNLLAGMAVYPGWHAD